MSEMSQAGMARAIMGGASRYKGHIIVASGPMENPRSIELRGHIPPSKPVLGGLCGSLDQLEWSPCPACEVMEQVFGANMPYEWARRVPFYKDGVFTRGVRYWLLSILGHSEDSEIFGRWQAAKTFEYLNSQMQKIQRPQDHTDDYGQGIFPCCHYCGAECKHGFPGSVCGVCEGKILTRPAMSVTTLRQSVGR